MKTVNELAKTAHISVRTLHHYDAIGLLKPTQITQAGYRLYDEEAQEKLYLILLFREIGFPLKEIQGILEAPDFDRNRCLEQQVELLKAKIDHLQTRIHLANGIKLIGVRYLEFHNWDPKKIDEYQAQAKTLYGKTDAYKEYEQKAKGRTQEEGKAINAQIMDFFVRLGAMKDRDPGCEAVQTWVKELQAYFTEHFYTCTSQILLGLGEMYAGGGTMTENIDSAGGKGTGEFALKAIRIYCKDK
ncbi:MAG: MerR family transcriptional regulator [Oscillospiraceae bacterium]|nr:MerR family transcriptional regulator [Oscillospiraceae bacterium]MBQ7130782.1 MerR family transcriptional regulator [Oscillospiraceae bacterium]